MPGHRASPMPMLETDDGGLRIRPIIATPLAAREMRVGCGHSYNAHSAAQESNRKDEGAALGADIDRQLRTHVEKQRATISSVLAHFSIRRTIDLSASGAFVDDEGLARLVERYVGPKNSMFGEILSSP